MNWDDIKVLLAVMRSKSLSRAAVMLKMDQSTVSRRLSAVEADLGTILFVRSKTGIAPTEAGDRVLQHALEVERRIDRLAEEAATETSELVGTLRLVGNAWVLNRLIETVLPAFTDAHPRLLLRIVTWKPEVRMRGDATLSLWFERPPEPGEFAIKLGEVPFAAYGPRGVVPPPPGWVSFFDEDAPRRAPVRAWEAARGKDETLTLTATDATLLCTAVRQGVGKGILPQCLAEHDPCLERLDMAAGGFIRTLHLHAHPDTVQNLRVQKTIRLLRDHFEEVFLP